MTQKHKTYIQIIFSLSALFMTVVFFAWSLLPYIQMNVFYKNLRKAINGNPMPLIESRFSFYPFTYVQPQVRNGLVGHIFGMYIKGDQKGHSPVVSFAVDKLEESILREANYADSFLSLGKGYDLLADFSSNDVTELRKKAENHYKHALEIFPDNQRILYAYAINQAYQGKIDEAVKIAQQLLDADPRVSESHYYFGALSYMQDGVANSDIALDNIEYAIHHNGDPSPSLTKKIYAKMFIYYYKVGDIERFKTVAQSMVSYDEKQAPVYIKIIEYINANKTLPVINLK